MQRRMQFDNSLLPANPSNLTVSVVMLRNTVSVNTLIRKNNIFLKICLDIELANTLFVSTLEAYTTINLIVRWCRNLIVNRKFRSIQNYIVNIQIISHCFQFSELIYRTIYTAEQLSINKYERDRRRMMVNLLPDLRDLKRNHMQRILRHKIVPPTMMNDLMQFMHMIEDTESDFLLLESALNRIKTVEIDNLRQTSIGSVLMRLLHYFRKDEFAISVIRF